MDYFFHLQSLVNGIVSAVLEIAVFTCQWLNVDVIVQGKSCFFRESQGKYIGFQEKSRKFVLSS